MASDNKKIKYSTRISNMTLGDFPDEVVPLVEESDSVKHCD
jgi:hypothetical protein